MVRWSGVREIELAAGRGDALDAVGVAELQELGDLNDLPLQRSSIQMTTASTRPASMSARSRRYSALTSFLL
jgi:hypothetical protein